MSLIEEITVENLDEYKGIVAGLIDEIVGLTQLLGPNIAQTLSVRGKNQYDY